MGSLQIAERQAARRPTFRSALLRPILILLLQQQQSLLSLAVVIPGATQTTNGYDVEDGTDAICWMSKRAAATTSAGIPFPGPLVQNFRLDKAIEIQESCPENNLLQAIAPVEFLNGERLRIGTKYYHHVRITLDLRTLGGQAFISDVQSHADGHHHHGAAHDNASEQHVSPEEQQHVTVSANDLEILRKYKLTNETNVLLAGSRFNLHGRHRIAVRMYVCKQGTGFCSPFLDDHATRKDATHHDDDDDAADTAFHGGTHVMSQTVFVSLDPDDGPVYDILVRVPLVMPVSGRFFIVAGAQMFLTGRGAEDNSGREDGYDQHQGVGHQHRRDSMANEFAAAKVATTRIDIANALIGDQRLLTFQEPAQILEVHPAALITSYVAIGIVACTLVWLIVETRRHYTHQIICLSQGRSLLAYLITGLAAALSCFLLQPKSDIYCQASAPIILSCLHFSWAVTSVRLWRINAIMSPLLKSKLRRITEANEQGLIDQGLIESLLDKLCDWVSAVTRKILLQCGCTRKPNIRRQISCQQLAFYVFLITLPQVILQLLAVTLQPRKLKVYYNEDESVGRMTCAACASTGRSFTAFGFYYFLTLLAVLLLMARRTNHLPSLFNETQIIFKTTLSALLLLAFGTGVLAMTNLATVSPTYEYLIWVFVILFMTTQSTLRIMLPKLRMVWRNETILVSQLVTDQVSNGFDSVGMKPNNYGERSTLTTQRIGGRITVSGLSEPLRSTCMSSGAFTATSFEAEASSVLWAAKEQTACKRPADVTTVHHGQNPEPAPQPAALGASYQAQSAGPLGDDYQEALLRVSGRSIASKSSAQGVIRISKERSPQRQLVLKMMDLQAQLVLVNRRIMTGLPVSEEDWHGLRRKLCKMGHTFEANVLFEWEESERLGTGLSCSIGAAEVVATPARSLPAAAGSGRFEPSLCSLYKSSIIQGILESSMDDSSSSSCSYGDSEANAGLQESSATTTSATADVETGDAQLVSVSI